MSLKVENLTVYYQTLKGEVRELENATFNLADGEIMGLAGESGCGKTTILRMKREGLDILRFKILLFRMEKGDIWQTTNLFIISLVLLRLIRRDSQF